MAADHTIDVWHVRGDGRAALRDILSSYEDEEPNFSVSRSGGRALVAVRGQGPVGVDIEQIKPGRPTKRIAARMFSPEESGLAATPVGFYRCWTAKEAYAKGLGLGLRLAFASFSVAAIKEGRGTVAHPGHAPGEVEVVAVGGGYAAAVAAPAGSWNYQLREWQRK
jgi:4'-phosphopantetheinyl transferase